MKKAGIFCAVFLIALAAFGMADEEKKVKPSANPVIGFDESFGPAPGNTLAGNFSKMKTALEGEFGATVEVNNSGWFNLSKYDVYIVPTRFMVRPSGSDLDGLKAYVENGGCLIVLWHSLCELACTGNLDPDANWPGTGFHDSILEGFARINAKSAFPNSNDMVSFSAAFGTTPNAVSRVRGLKAAFLHSTLGGGATFIGRNSQGQPIAGFRENIGSGKGKIFIIGSLYAFQNTLIDQSDNKKFLYNLVAKCTGDGGGGGGGGGGGLVIKKVKGKPKVLAPGNDMTSIIVVRNTGGSASAATTAQFYLSTNTVIDGADVFIGSLPIPAINPGKKTKQKVKVLVPNLPANFYYVVGKLMSTSEEKASKKQVEVR